MDIQAQQAQNAINDLAMQVLADYSSELEIDLEEIKQLESKENTHVQI